MNLFRAKVLVMLLAAATLIFITLCSFFQQTWMLMAGAGCFLAMMAVWTLFNRCPHCGKHLGNHTSPYCPYCRKRL